MKKRKLTKRRLKPKVQPLTREQEDALLPDMETKIVKLSWLKRWKKNPRDNEDAVPKLANLIREHGFRVPIICTPEGKIWSGDTRYLAAESIGMSRVRVLITEFESTAKAMMFALADNVSSEWARWDPDLLSDAFRARKTMDISEMSKLSGFSPIQIQKSRGTSDLPDMPDGFGAGEMATPLDPTTLEGKDESWYRIVITCKDEEEKKQLFRLLGIKGKKTVYTLGDLKVRAVRKTVKKRKIA